MWKVIKGDLHHVTDNSRESFRANISKNLLTSLQQTAKDNNTYVNYLLENGISNLLASKDIHYNKKQRPKDRVRYNTTYDSVLLKELKSLAKSQGLYASDLIELSTNFIELPHVKDSSYRHRVDLEEGDD